MRARWLLSFLLVNLPDCCAAAGPPAPPSNLECFIPCHGNDCRPDIECVWDPKPDPQTPTNYSLHWDPALNDEAHETIGTSLNGIIYRKQYYSHSDLRVWVQAKNQHGSVRSQDFVFNTANINKPSSPPNNILSQQTPLEVFWTFTCDQQQQQCDVRHRIEADQVWKEDGGIIHESYAFDSLQHGVIYEFQVRCSCSTGLMSDWSEVQRVSSESAPVGKLDLWRDCGMSPAGTDCVLTWKKLPLSQARGHILGYEVKLSDNNRAMSMNVSTADPRGWLVCDEVQCHLNSSLKDVSASVSASVSAYNAHGVTRPSHLTLPTQGKEKNEQALRLQMDEENLTVSWVLDPGSSQLSDDLEYVVQYKHAESPPGQGFDWVRVTKGNTTGTFKGHFTKYKPYQVSLFTVSPSGDCCHRSSVIGYSRQGTPSEVPSFKVDSIHADRVTLFWEPVPLLRENGVTLYYQIGVNPQNVVYNVNVSQQPGNPTFELVNLSPNQEYVVWIRAVTLAGPGANFTTTFTTNPPEDGRFVYLIPVLLVIVAVICFPVLFSIWKGESKVCPLFFYEKVPDPNNSRIFRQMKHQINDPLAWICVPVNEPHPHISVLEVVETQPRDLETTSQPDGIMRPAGEMREDAVPEESGDRTEHKCRKEEYSKMVDSDEEREQEEDKEDSWNSSDEEQFTSGYEKHFMPTVLEVLDV